MDTISLAPHSGTERQLDTPITGTPVLDIEALANTLAFLVVRDDARPAAWLTPQFSRAVAALRTMLSTARDLTSLALLVGRLESQAAQSAPHHGAEGAGGGTFESATRRLAGDATSVAIAIRWQEIHGEMSLPAWPELLRRHSLAGRSLDPDLDRTLWFG